MSGRFAFYSPSHGLGSEPKITLPIVPSFVISSTPIAVTQTIQSANAVTVPTQTTVLQSQLIECRAPPAQFSISSQKKFKIKPGYACHN